MEQVLASFNVGKLDDCRPTPLLVAKEPKRVLPSGHTRHINLVGAFEECGRSLGLVSQRNVHLEFLGMPQPILYRQRNREHALCRSLLTNPAFGFGFACLSFQMIEQCTSVGKREEKASFVLRLLLHSALLLLNLRSLLFRRSRIRSSHAEGEVRDLVVNASLPRNADLVHPEPVNSLHDRGKYPDLVSRVADRHGLLESLPRAALEAQSLDGIIRLGNAASGARQSQRITSVNQKLDSLLPDVVAHVRGMENNVERELAVRRHIDVQRSNAEVLSEGSLEPLAPCRHVATVLKVQFSNPLTSSHYDTERQRVSLEHHLEPSCPTAHAQKLPRLSCVPHKKLLRELHQPLYRAESQVDDRTFVRTEGDRTSREIHDIVVLQLLLSKPNLVLVDNVEGHRSSAPVHNLNVPTDRVALDNVAKINAALLQVKELKPSVNSLAADSNHLLARTINQERHLELIVLHFPRRK
mmetsp:Transcript_784/g.1294  ORF Transcript_784/g.1294 Transcript_784/m.1294 type:complete len:468 (-) Transcript_784:12555-13958(-)